VISGHTRAFVAVQNGCDHACTFCVIPQGRGPSRSRPIPEVLAEIAGHHDAGVHEAVLTGVDLTSWGADLPGAPMLGELVAAILTSFPGLERLRLSSLDGVEIDPLLLDLIGGERRVMPYLHLSLQSGDDLTLKRMKRRHSRRDAIALVESLRARRPGIAVGADIIAGFPTEDEAAHGRNLSIIRELGIVTAISSLLARPGTPAARMPQVDVAAIKARAAELRVAVAKERQSWLEALIGQPLQVLAERDGTGHSPEFARVQLEPGTMPGSIVTITPTRIIEECWHERRKLDRPVVRRLPQDVGAAFRKPCRHCRHDEAGRCAARRSRRCADPLGPRPRAAARIRERLAGTRFERGADEAAIKEAVAEEIAAILRPVAKPLEVVAFRARR